MKTYIVFVCLFYISTNLLVECSDLYQLLGVDKQASAKEIRKAFKKLALTMHPDKNRGDEEAHDKFLELNRAYEVLKDDETRKVYDQHGEEGLKEKPSHGGGYHSWNYYNQEFGIYDDDPEIITLSHSDFETSVEGSGDMWFVNFYSPHCSHCHDLAPAWRELAREMVGVVRVGAVNCEDDFMICRQKGVRSFPSLILYPGGEKYKGSRTKEQMISYIMSKVRSRVISLSDPLLQQSIKHTTKLQHLPWLISFCYPHSAECLEQSNLLKVASMLNELVNVGRVECEKDEGWCGGVVKKEGLYYFQAGKVAKDQGKEIVSYDAREVTQKVLEELPDIPLLDAQEMQDAISSSEPWLIHFVDGPFKDLDLRKLPSLVHTAKVGRVDCRGVGGRCREEWHIHKLPAVVLFKGGGDHEYHYGRQTAHDIAAFSKESLSSASTSLHPSNFPTLSEFSHPWIIDFFAPWCPPCMRLLPEFRKASKGMRARVRFGTVDCTTQQQLCNKYSIQSYPTTIFFNQSKPHNYHGHHSSQEIINFIEDVLNPPVISLDAHSFTSLVEERGPDEFWLVDFFAPWCGPCQQLAPEWRKLAKLFKDHRSIRVAQMDCQQHLQACRGASVNSYPTIRFYTKDSYTGYSGWRRDAPSLRTWAYSLLPSKAYVIDLSLFRNKVMGSSKPWVIDFYAPWCGHCQVFAPEFEEVAVRLKGRVRAGKVNCDDHQSLCQQVGIRGYPTVLYFPSNSQTYRGSEIDGQSANSVIDFVENQLRQESGGSQSNRIEL